MLPSSHDLIRLTRLTKETNAALGPVLLRVQADLFASAPVRDSDAVAVFETFALAILPQSDDDTLTYVARRVARLRETPEPVLRLLEKVEGFEAQGRELQSLVDRARNDGALARALLLRDDLPASEAARLYLQADRAARARIRSALAESAEASPAGLARPSREVLNGLVGAAAARDAALFGGRLAMALGIGNATPDWRFGSRARRDLLALALVAIGAPEEVCIRVFLTLDPEIARSVAAVFGQVEIVRRTPRSVAIRLLEASLDLRIALPRRAGARPEETSRAERDRLAGRPAALTPRQVLAAATGTGRARAKS
ncbi:MAG: hypothetical protein EA385_06250 [Salinarimonadaceae bacterium]|nr:MAG: hypothetical protein EA385_06250 [Salinarimonadaceae bacterium]